MGYFVIISIIAVSTISSFAHESMCNTGKKQSPIDLVKKKGITITGTHMDPIGTKHYNKSYSVSLFNVGTTVQLSFEGQNPAPVLSKGMFKVKKGEVVTLEQIHFHWKSEHTISGKRFPLEAHFVHFVRPGKEKIIVMGVLYQIGCTASDSFKEIVKHMNSISAKPNSPVKINFVPRSILPREMDDYFGYEGSLTTHHCDENVQWLVLNKFGFISKRQLHTLRNIFSEKNELVKKNYRQVQPLNDRKIYYSKKL